MQQRLRGGAFAVDATAVVVFILLALVPWSHFLQTEMSLGQMLAGPSWAHPLGTDNLGRDLLARLAQVISGAVIPLWTAVLLGSVSGLFLGACAVVLRQRILARPLLILLHVAALIVASLPVGIVTFVFAAWNEQAGLFPVLTTLAILFLVKSYLHVLDLYRHDRNLGFWQAHAAIGGQQLTRLWRYGFWGAWRWVLIDRLGFNLRAAVAIEAAMSYLGFGVQEPAPSFGNMLASHFDSYLHGHGQVLFVITGGLALTAFFPAALMGSIARLTRARANA